MRNEVEWVVYEEEKSTREWVKMPEDIIGFPLFEHATDYITILESGEKVMVRKEDNYIFENSGVGVSDKNHLATPEEVEKLRADARRKAEERRKRNLLNGKGLRGTSKTDERLYRSSSSTRKPREERDSHTQVTITSLKKIKECEYDKKVHWTVVYGSSPNGDWVSLPLGYKGQIIEEYWDSYKTTLKDGRVVIINKLLGEIVRTFYDPRTDEEKLEQLDEELKAIKVHSRGRTKRSSRQATRKPKTAPEGYEYSKGVPVLRKKLSKDT